MHTYKSIYTYAYMLCTNRFVVEAKRSVASLYRELEKTQETLH
jgi:hypothetical protein